MQSTIFHFERPVENVQRSMIVGDDDHAGVLFVGDLAEKLHHLSPANAVEGGGGPSARR